MNMFLRRIFFFALASMVPILMLISPNLLKIQGIGPCWPIICLLPFSLEIGPFWAVLFAILLASILDIITLSGASYIPSLALLGFWWGNLGKKQQKSLFRVHLGLLACFGTAVVGFSLWVQKIFFHSLSLDELFHAWAFHTLLSEIIITGLISPLFCSWIFILISKIKKS